MINISVVIKNMDMKKDKKYMGKNMYMYSAKIYESEKIKLSGKSICTVLRIF
jgi:hypothetical protein